MRIYPIFLPGTGCRTECIYCDQKKTSPRPSSQTLKEIRKEIKTFFVASELRVGAQLAFFGGTFTGLDPDFQEALLQTATEAMAEGGIRPSIRISTHPSLVDSTSLDLLRQFPVDVIELGIQSFDSKALKLTNRGYDSDLARTACRSVKDAGFELIIQLMPGLPGSSLGGDLASAKAAVSLRPAGVRLYPLCVVRGTALHKWVREGRYSPMSLEQGISLTSRMLEIVAEAGVPVLRVGLAEQPGLAEQIVGGPHHPAFGDLVWIDLVVRRILGLCEDGIKLLGVTERAISLIRGHGQRGQKMLTHGAPQLELEFTVSPGRMTRPLGSLVLGKYSLSFDEDLVLLDVVDRSGGTEMEP